MPGSISFRAGAVSIALSLVFFLVTATTFASLGVMLPSMIAEFGWDWGAAGLGFTMLALLTGVFSPVAAKSLEQLGPRIHYAFAGTIAVLGYILLSRTNGLQSYLIAAALLGAAFALLANVPGTYIIGRAVSEKWRNIAIGIYLAAGGAGGVLGPLMANAAVLSGAGWRTYWLAAALLVGVTALIIVSLAERRFAQGVGPSRLAAAPDAASVEWSARAAIRTPAFWVIALALCVAYFCGVTVSTWSVTHLQTMGLPETFAVGMFSLYSAMNAGARALGGAAVKRISARALLAFALFANVAGMTALAFASSAPVAIAFALFDGFAFGMALFASTALLIKYFGLDNSPALLGAVNLAATVAMLGPTVAGAAAEATGGFAPVFIIYAVLALIAGVTVALMRDPGRRK